MMSPNRWIDLMQATVKKANPPAVGTGCPVWGWALIAAAGLGAIYGGAVHVYEAGLSRGLREGIEKCREQGNER